MKPVSLTLTTTPLGLAVNYCLDFKLRCVTSSRMPGRASCPLEIWGRYCPLEIWGRSCCSSPAAFLQILRRDYFSLTMQLASERQRARKSQGGSIVSACCVLSQSLWLTPHTSRLANSDITLVIRRDGHTNLTNTSSKRLWRGEVMKR